MPANTRPDISFREFAALMAMLMSIIAISIDAMLPALGIIAGDFHLAGRNHAQYVIGTLFLGLSLGQMICGPLSDALGRKKVLYGSIMLYLAGSVICYVAPSFGWLLAGRVIQGIGVAGPDVVTLSVVRDKYAGAEMARVMSIVMMIFMMVPAIAPSLGQGILFVASWRVIFLMYVFYALGVTLWLYLRLEETLPPERRIPLTKKSYIDGVKEVIGNRACLCYMLCMATCFGGLIGYLNSAQQIFQEKYHTGPWFTLYFGGLAIVIGAASLMNAKIVDRFGMHNICVWSFSAIIAASAVFMGLHAALGDISLWGFLAYASVLFFSFGLVFGNLNALAMEPMGHIAGMASAIIGAVALGLSMVLGGVIGQLYDGTLIPTAMGFLVLGIASRILLYLAESRGLNPSQA